jgi:hypothetical protein
MTFKKVGSGVTITSPQFPGYALTTSEISSTLSTINGVINEYKAGNENGVSGHRYNVKTAVDYSWSSAAINSTTKGRTIRKIKNSKVYFWNIIEFDSDYTNKNQYGSQIKDYKRKRVNLQNGEVYDVTDGAFINTYDKLTPYDNANIDNYYLLLQDSFLKSSNISMIKTTATGGTTTYALGLTSAGILELLRFVDDSIRMDVTLENEHTMFNVLQNSLVMKSLKFNIEVTNGKLTKIDILLKGSYVDSVEKDEYNVNKTPNFTLEYLITPYYNVTTYKIPAVTKDIDMSNS